MIDTDQADCTRDRRFRAFVLLAPFASLRSGEIAAVTRADPDIDAGMVRVRLAYVERCIGERQLSVRPSPRPAGVLATAHDAAGAVLMVLEAALPGVLHELQDVYPVT
ncbi:hypothetical protein [Nonomuraea sp. WAC 01424]|uniref:hypothetical protein n=1 Tax=Nonomuraea sp. WAC 01424 TaxID=2203200 RepID=UPI000F79C82D|nr:hypothetical protein [Nonomuraea sp. WAC 01424]